MQSWGQSRDYKTTGQNSASNLTRAWFSPYICALFALLLISFWQGFRRYLGLMSNEWAPHFEVLTESRGPVSPQTGKLPKGPKGAGRRERDSPCPAPTAPHSTGWMGLLTWGDVGSQVSQTASPQIWSLEVDDLSGQAARSVVSTSLQPHWGCNPIVYQAPHQWIFPGKNTGVGFHFLLQRIFLIQGSNPRFLLLLNCRWILYH